MECNPLTPFLVSSALPNPPIYFLWPFSNCQNCSHISPKAGNFLRKLSSRLSRKITRITHKAPERHLWIYLRSSLHHRHAHFPFSISIHSNQSLHYTYKSIVLRWIYCYYFLEYIIYFCIYYLIILFNNFNNDI